MSAVRGHLFSIFTDALRIWAVSPHPQPKEAPEDSTWSLPLRYFSLTVLSWDCNNGLLIPPDEGDLCTDVINLPIKISCLHTKKPSSFFRAHLCIKT